MAGTQKVSSNNLNKMRKISILMEKCNSIDPVFAHHHQSQDLNPKTIDEINEQLDMQEQNNYLDQHKFQRPCVLNSSPGHNCENVTDNASSNQDLLHLQKKSKKTKQKNISRDQLLSEKQALDKIYKDFDNVNKESQVFLKAITRAQEKFLNEKI